MTAILIVTRTFTFLVVCAFLFVGFVSINAARHDADLDQLWFGLVLLLFAVVIAVVAVIWG